jgi:hypothetical protein
MSDNYTYSISADFLNGKVATDRLTDEIRTSAIVTALNGITTAGDNCDIWFKSALSSGDQAILDGIVDVHTGEPLEPRLQVQPVREVSTDKLDPDTSNAIYDGGSDDVNMVLEVVSGVNPTVWEKVLDYAWEPVGAEAFIPLDDVHWEYGDKINFLMFPPNNGLIGVLASGTPEGQNKIYGSESVITNVKPGFFLRLGLDDSSVYKIKEVDLNDYKIILYKGLAVARSEGDPVFLHVYYLCSWPVIKGYPQRFADMTPGAKNVPAGWTIRMEYVHKTMPSSNYERPFGLVYQY